MRQLPSGSITLNDANITTGRVIKASTFQDIQKAQGAIYGWQSTNGCCFYMGDAETGETTYSYLNEGAEPGIQLDEFRPVLRPIRKMQDYEQTVYYSSYPPIRRNINGNYYAVVSGYGINCTASFDFYKMFEITENAGGLLTGSSTNTVTLTFPASDYQYREAWVYLDDMNGSDSVNITGYRAEMQWKVTAGTGYMKYAAIEECKKVNHSTYINHCRLYGDEIVQPYPSSVTIDAWRNDGAQYELGQLTSGQKPTMFSDPANFSYCYFDGTADVLTGSADFSVGDGGMYFAVCLKPDVSAATRYILDHQNSTQYCTRILIQSTDVVRWITRHTAGLNTLDMSTALTESAWNDVAFAVFPDPDVPGTMKKQIYLNGVLDAEVTGLTAYDSTTDGPVALGNIIGGSIHYPGYMALPVMIAVEDELSGSFCERDINGLNLSWRRTWGLGQ